jgi:15-cis-phytoene synthase
MTADHVAEALRKTDRDRYFATLFLPEAIRADAQALYAFNAEIASVRDRVSEPAPGEIRLQWWVDAIKGQGYGAVQANPVAAALLTAIERHQLPTVPLLRLIAARRFDLYDDPMPDVQTFEGYAGETVSVFYQFIAMMLNGDAVVEDGDAAGHLGVAHALVGHLRAFGFNAARGRIFLPWALLAANGVNEQEVFARTASEGMLAAHAQLCDLAKDHLDKAEAAIGRLPKALRPAFAPLPVLRTALRQVEKQNARPFAAAPEQADWRKIGAMAWWVWRNG